MGASMRSSITASVAQARSGGPVTVRLTLSYENGVVMSKKMSVPAGSVEHLTQGLVLVIAERIRASISELERQGTLF